nr:HNH endonuclease [Actinomycetales bacterium]
SRPGCDQPAMYCDTDHLDEWAHGGETALTNLTLLCRRCHRTKTLHAGRLISVDTAGRRFWKSPLGVIYTGRAPRPPRRFIPGARSDCEGDDSARAENPDSGPPPY